MIMEVETTTLDRFSRRLQNRLYTRTVEPLADTFVLECTEEMHDRVDRVAGKSLERRATLAGQLEYYCKELMRYPLTDDQCAEVNQVRHRLYIECLNVDHSRADRLLARIKEEGRI